MVALLLLVACSLAQDVFWRFTGDMLKQVDQEPGDQAEWDKFAVKATWKFLCDATISTFYALVPDTSKITVDNCSHLNLEL